MIYNLPLTGGASLIGYAVVGLVTVGTGLWARVRNRKGRR